MRSAWRNFVRNKAHIGINLVGLTLALTVTLLIYLFVADELSYDRWIEDHQQVVRIHPIITTSEGEKQSPPFQ